jgi:hypothetical protein
MLGLDAAGKTTILYKLHIGEVLSTVPTIGALRMHLWAWKADDYPVNKHIRYHVARGAVLMLRMVRS